MQNNIWPSIFPTSCISLRRSFFLEFIKFSKKNFFPNLEIDARMIIFAYHYHNDFNILRNKLTIYLKDEDGITSKYKNLTICGGKKDMKLFAI